MVEPFFEAIRSLTDHVVCTQIKDLGNGKSWISQTLKSYPAEERVDTSRQMVIHDSVHFSDWYDLSRFGEGKTLCEPQDTPGQFLNTTKT